jgi:hypothetical protein
MSLGYSSMGVGLWRSKAGDRELLNKSIRHLPWLFGLVNVNEGIARMCGVQVFGLSR